MSYKLYRDGLFVRDLTTNADMPVDHPRYLAWLAEGNTPEPFETLDEAKARRRQELKDEGRRWVFQNYSFEDQINAALGILTAQEVTDIKDRITTARTAFATARTAVNAAVDIAEVDSVSMTLP